MRKNYIGLACTTHDPAVAVVDAEGRLVYAEGTERYLQTKRAFNTPPDNITRIPEILRQYCEPGADLVVAKTWSRIYPAWTRLNRQFFELIGRLVRPGSAFGEAVAFMRMAMALQHTCVIGASEGLRFQYQNNPDLADFDGRITYRHFPHHLTHAAAACYSSPFREAVCAVIDGFGETSSTAYYHYRDGKIKKLRALQRSLGSLGFFYMSLCTACGFDPAWGEEWKVMGLAPFGKLDQEAYDLLKPIMKVKGLRMPGWLRQSRTNFWRYPPSCPPEDLAFTGQKVFEETMEKLLTNLHGRAGSDNLVLGGGCALNSSWNGQILDRTPFENLHVFCAPADDGCAVGAALLAYYRDHPLQRPPEAVQLPYLGSEMSPRALENVVQFDRNKKVSHHPGTIHQVAAQALAEGKIIGWVQGRAEFGPRALGNRSILADPRRPDVKDEINRRVKFREEFRPFAPSILHEHGPEYFEHYQQSPYMERTLRFKPEVVDKVPGVVHVNGTGRLQTVKREWNEKYYRLIEEFYRLSGVPLVLNTSFNVMGKPIIHSVQDAMAVLHTTDLDLVIIDDYLIEK